MNREHLRLRGTEWLLFTLCLWLNNKDRLSESIDVWCLSLYTSFAFYLIHFLYQEFCSHPSPSAFVCPSLSFASSRCLSSAVTLRPSDTTSSLYLRLNYSRARIAQERLNAPTGECDKGKEIERMRFRLREEMPFEGKYINEMIYVVQKNRKASLIFK